MSGNDSGGASMEERLVTELELVAAPVTEAAELGPRGAEKLIQESGIGQGMAGSELDQVVELVLDEVVPVLETVTEALGDGEISDADEALDLIEGFVDLFDAVRTLSQVEVSDPNIDAIGTQLLDYLIVRYLSVHHQDVHSGLVLAGLIEDPPEAPVDLDLSKLDDLVQDPNALVVDTIGWGSDDGSLDPFLLLFYLHELLEGQGLPASFGNPDADTLENATGGTLADEISTLESQTTEGMLPLDSLYEVGDLGNIIATRNTPSQYVDVALVEASTGALGLRFVPLPGHSTPDGEKLPGAALFPYGVLQWEHEEDLGDGWTLNLSIKAEQDDWGLSFQPEKGGEGTKPELVSPDQGSIGGEVHGKAELVYSPTGDDGPGTVLLGERDGTNITLSSFSARAAIDYGGDDVTVRVELPTSGGFQVKPQGGFLSKVLSGGFGFDFDATVGWSNVDGVYFEGGGTLDASIPLHIDLGFASVEELYLAVNPAAEDSDLTLEAAASPKISLGPLKGSVKRMGIEADLSFPADRDGNVGPLDLDVGFRPPNGLALAVDTGPVTGGGFMVFEPEKHRYAGGLELQFSSWGLKVVGLLKTKLPDSDGFSLLLLVTADLPPIQLGFGFVMNGIGGLAGIHRGFKKTPLGKAVRSGNLDSVLFPEDVVENADQIISDLRAIFPPKGNKHVFGPMLRLGWGTPVIIQAELGVLVAIPDWKIALLGKFMVDLPDEEVALVDINLAVVGLLDIPNKELAIDASLYDSRIVTWTVSGDMAMRLSWGSEARFMLSLGGFHPKYEPPKSFPELDRIKASMAVPGGNPRLEYTGYLAVTPNTFQVGAGVVLHGKFGPAVVHGELSFDALFRFNPFMFIIDFLAKVSVKIKGMGLGLELDGSFSGPQPYHVKGTLKIDVLLLSVTVKVNAKFGPKPQSKEMPTANVLPTLADELATPANWSAQDPEGGVQLVTLRDPDADGEKQNEGEPSVDTLLAHPLGSLSVRQQVVPLGVPIEKYGNAKPVHEVHELSALSVTGVDEDLGGQSMNREKFAPAKFKEMSDSEKLNAEPFERLPAGRAVENGTVHYAGSEDGHTDLLSWATLDFETSVIDEENDSYRTGVADVAEGWETKMGLGVAHGLAEQSAVATADSRTTGPQAYANPDQSLSVSVSDQMYVVVWADTLQRLDVDANPAEGQTQTEAEAFRDHYVADHDDVAAGDLRVVGCQEVADSNGGGSP